MKKTARKDTNARKGRELGERSTGRLSKRKSAVYVGGKKKKHLMNATCENIPRKIDFFHGVLLRKI